MTQVQTTPSPGKTNQDIKDEGYRAQAAGKTLQDNPYLPIDSTNHWNWRAGFLEAFKDSH